MNYEKKYKEALERASKLKVQNPFDTVGQMVEHIFPELKESKDERMKEQLSEYLHDNMHYKDAQEITSWLEKLIENQKD